MPRAQISSREKRERALRNKGLLRDDKNEPQEKAQPSISAAEGAKLKPDLKIPGAPEYVMEEPPDAVKTDARRGRLTDALAMWIARIVSEGVFPSSAAVYCGVPRGTWDEWMGRAKRGDEPYVTLRVLVDQGREIAVRRLTRIISEAAGKGYWQAAARMLESFDSENWIRRERIDREEVGDTFKGILEELKELRRNGYHPSTQRSAP